MGVQVVGYETEPAALLIAAEGTVRRESLASGTRLDYALGERRCAGAFDGAGHVACDSERAPYCSAHSHTWVCARCTGTCLKERMDCYRPHAVYLAAFAPATFKVGVTKLSRLRRRLREQGADRGAHLRTVPNGRIAREIEAEIREGGVADRVRVPQKISGLHRAVDDSAWDDLCAEFSVGVRTRFDYGLDLSSRPVTETLASGRVVGAKGRVVVVERAGSAYAVDLRDLVGYELREGETGRALQSSLGAF